MSELQAPLELALGGYSESNFATAGNIRDRIYALIEAIVPTTLTRDKFRRYRNEGGARFREASEASPTGAFRRFQVRETGDDSPPDVSNMTEERVRATFEIVIAYPQTHRYGPDNAMDRDDVAFDDWKALNNLVGIYSRGRYSGSYDCTPLGAVMTREQGDACDFLVIEAVFEYMRSVL